MSTKVLIVGLVAFWVIALPAAGFTYNLIAKRDKRLSADEMVMSLARFLCSLPVIVVFALVYILALIRGV